MTSKTSSLKALLLRAWRERWSDLQWGINIKTILPRGVSGDVYNLADCILQQALVGPGPNLLVLSYLRHSLSSQLVSYAAVLQRISKYDGFHKPYCIMILLEFLETIQGGITCRGKPEEGALAMSILAIVQWLLTCMHQTLTNMNLPESRILLNGSIDQTDFFLEKPANLIKDILKSDFLSAMLYLAKYENIEIYNEMIKKCQELQTLLNSSNSSQNTVVQESLRMLSKDFDENTPENVDTEPVTYCLQPLLTVNVLLNPSSDTSIFVNQLLMIQRLKGYSTPRLYAEIIRACLITLNDVLGTSEESQWGAFTFLKIPHIIKQIHFTKNDINQIPLNTEYSQDVIDAFEMLLQHMPLLDIMDTRCSCNCIECLLNEFHKYKLVTEAQIKHFASIRDTASIPRNDQNNPQNNSITKFIIRAEPTLARILKTLDADYNKIQDAIVSVLCQVLTGKSFELILAVATVQGQLPIFVAKLLKFNEYSKQISGETPKLAHSRAMLFDVSFLMLCSIVHTYGSEVVLSAKGGDTFFETWVRECMVERGRPKSPDQMLQLSDPAKVEALLAQLNSSEFDFKNNQVKWYEICLTIPATMKDVLIAWENGSLTANDVKRILDAMRSRMCCFPVCAAAWLCSYMQILHQDALLKPMNMVQQFLTTPANEEVSQVEFYKERSGLMCQIIRKMQYAINPPTQSNASVAVMTLTHSLLSSQPVSEQLSKVWATVQHRGWIDIESAHSFESFLNTGGSRWFVSRILHEILKFRYVEELDLAVDLAFGVFHLDIEKCTLSLLNDIMPHFLQNRLTNDDLVEPQVSALAKLCAYCIFATLEFQNNPSNITHNLNRKRSRRDMEGEDIDNMCSTNKLIKLTNSSESTNGSLSYSAANGSIPNDLMPNLRPFGNTQTLIMKEPLLSALTDIFSMFSNVAARDGEVSQQTCFICRFLQHSVLCGRDRTRLVLQAMPTNLVPSMLKSLPHMFKNDLLLKLYDIQTVQGRKETARDLCMLRNMTLKALSRTVR